VSFRLFRPRSPWWPLELLRLDSSLVLDTGGCRSCTADTARPHLAVTHPGGRMTPTFGVPRGTSPVRPGGGGACSTHIGSHADAPLGSTRAERSPGLARGPRHQLAAGARTRPIRKVRPRIRPTGHSIPSAPCPLERAGPRGASALGDQTVWILISMSTPAGRSSRWSESTVLGV